MSTLLSVCGIVLYGCVAVVSAGRNAQQDQVTVSMQSNGMVATQPTTWAASRHLNKRGRNTSPHGGKNRTAALLQQNEGRDTSLVAKQGFTIGNHKEITSKAAQKMMDADTRLLAILGSNFIKDLADGTAWPDCPAFYPDQKGRLCAEYESDFNTCVSLPVVGDAGLHQGLYEMLGQVAKQKVPIKGKWRRRETIGADRMLAQHQHASPLPTVYIFPFASVDPNNEATSVRRYELGNPECRRSTAQPATSICHLRAHTKLAEHPYALSTNRQVRNKIIEQSGKWYCQAMHHFTTALLVRRDVDYANKEEARAEEVGHYHSDTRYRQPISNSSGDGQGWGSWSDQAVTWTKGAKPRSAAELEPLLKGEERLGAHFLGRIFHTLQDSFSKSHAKRKDAVELDAVVLEQLFTMDDVAWSKHGNADKDKDKWFSLAGVSTGFVLQEFRSWIRAMHEQLSQVKVASKNIIDTLEHRVPGDAPSPGAKIFNTALVRMVNQLCKKGYAFDRAKLEAPAGGAIKEYAQSNQDWEPQGTLDASLAQEYLANEQIYDYPPNDQDICGSAVREPSKYRRPSRTPNGILAGDGLAIGRDRDISLTCAGLGARSTISLQEVSGDTDSNPIDVKEPSPYSMTTQAHWELYNLPAEGPRPA